MQINEVINLSILTLTQCVFRCFRCDLDVDVLQYALYNKKDVIITTYFVTINFSLTYANCRMSKLHYFKNFLMFSPFILAVTDTGRSVYFEGRVP